MPRKPESKSARRVAPAKPDVAPKGPGGRVPAIKQGKYADGLPLHEVQYLESKIILRPNGFTSRKSLENFGKLLRRPARQAGVGFEPCDFANQPLQIREVLFLDTDDFRLYNNAFILRRRVPYSEGFPIGDPEIVFKFRHPDIQKAAETDVRPQILGDYRIKFKAEALPLKDGLGGMRLLFSHNVEFGLSAIHEGDANSMDTLVNLLPVLGSLKRSPGEKIELVCGTIVEEVLQDVATPGFRQGRHGHGQRRPLAVPGRSSSSRRGVRVPDQVQAPRGAQRQGHEARRDFFPDPPGRRQGLDRPRGDEDRRRLPTERESSPGSRIKARPGARRESCKKEPDSSHRGFDDLLRSVLRARGGRSRCRFVRSVRTPKP